MSNEPQINSFKVLGGGNSDWFREVLAPMEDELQIALPRHLGEIPPPMRQRMTRSEPVITNAWGKVLLIGVAFYVLRKADKIIDKVLDEGFDVILKPRVTKLWHGLDSKLHGANQKGEKAFMVSIWYEQYGVLVSVVVLGATFDEILAQMDTMKEVHANALGLIKAKGVSAPVHHYLLEAGKVNAEPLLFEREEEVVKKLMASGKRVIPI